MNQLELILENIRLSHTERLLQEAQTDLELIRGQRLINESVMAIRGALLQEGIRTDFVNRANNVNQVMQPAVTGLLGGGVLGAGAGYLAGQVIDDQYDTDPTLRANLPYEKMPAELKDAYDQHGVEGVKNYMQLSKVAVQDPTAYTGAVVGGIGGGLAGGLAGLRSGLNGRPRGLPQPR